jgi:hypothetical protein
MFCLAKREDRLIIAKKIGSEKGGMDKKKRNDLYDEFMNLLVQKEMVKILHAWAAVILAMGGLNSKGGP